MSAGNAKIGHPAPQFKVTAVVDGQFKDVQLSDYRGTAGAGRGTGLVNWYLMRSVVFRWRFDVEVHA